MRQRTKRVSLVVLAHKVSAGMLVVLAALFAVDIIVWVTIQGRGVLSYTVTAYGALAGLLVAICGVIATSLAMRRYGMLAIVAMASIMAVLHPMWLRLLCGSSSLMTKGHYTRLVIDPVLGKFKVFVFSEGVFSIPIYQGTSGLSGRELEGDDNGDCSFIVVGDGVILDVNSRRVIS